MLRTSYSLKTMRRVARQRDEHKRHLYFLALSRILERPEQLCSRTRWAKTGMAAGGGVGGLPWERGWVGSRGRGKHISILALYGITGFLDFDYLEGGFDSDDFMTAVEYMVIPHLNAWPADGSILVIDNCRTHRHYEANLRRLVVGVGARILFHALYSPIDNPSEMAFSSFKAYWRRAGHPLDQMPLHTKIKWCLENCGANGPTAESARAAFRPCGYF